MIKNINLSRRVLNLFLNKEGFLGIVLFENKLRSLNLVCEDKNLEYLDNLEEKHQKIIIHMIDYYINNSQQLSLVLKDYHSEKHFNFIKFIFWSNIITLILFNILEYYIKQLNLGKFDRNGYLKKSESIFMFLNKNLSKMEKNIFSKTFNEKLDSTKNFDDILKFFWYDVRSGFIHDAAIYNKLIINMPFKEKNIEEISTELIFSFIRIVWMSILNHSGFKSSEYLKIKIENLTSIEF